MIHAPQYGIQHGQRVIRSQWKCSHKVRHDTEMKALGAAVRGSVRVPLRVYECPECGGWHLTKKINRE